MTKVFCIGFHKTGTSSVGRALGHLGFRVTGPNFVNDTRIHKNLWSLARPLIDEYDAFQDNPWPILFREVERYVPNAGFLLTLRDPDDWILSVEKFFGSQETQMRALIYGAGSPDRDRDKYLARYRAHYEEVESYFADRPGRLLRMNVFQGDGWEGLCSFLDKPVPDLPFPHIRPQNQVGQPR